MSNQASSDQTLFDDHAAAQYLREVIQQASAGLFAAQATYLAAIGSEAAGDLFFNARGVANAAAMVSKLLWPSVPWKRGSDEDLDQFERRKRLVVERGPALRQILEVPDESPLQNRAVRDAVEHFDERLDRRLSSPDRNIMLNNVGPASMIHFEGAREPFYLNLYDPETTNYTILGDTMNIREIEAALMALLQAALREQRAIEQRRYSSPR